MLDADTFQGLMVGAGVCFGIVIGYITARFG